MKTITIEIWLIEQTKQIQRTRIMELIIVEIRWIISMEQDQEIKIMELIIMEQDQKMEPKLLIIVEIRIIFCVRLELDMHI